MSSRPSRALRAVALLLLALAIELLFPALALARGGGGGHGGGGGGGVGGGGGGGFSGGGGGFSGGGGGLGFVGFGGFGTFVIVAIIVIVAAGYFMRARGAGGAGGEGGENTLGEGWTEPTTHADPAVAAGVAAIRESDPGFEPESFLQRAELAYLLVKRAYQDRNAAQGRAFLSAELWQQWRGQVQTLIAARQTPVLENLNVRGMSVEGAAHTAEGDQLAVHFDVVAAEHVVDDQTGKPVSGTTEDQRLGERWTFWRAPGAQTVASGGVTASRCPSCGAQLELDEEGRCRYCGADIPSGRFDWIVVDMAPAYFAGVQTASAFGAAELDRATGLGAIARDDPAFQEQAFLERAQQAFFALQQAWQERDLTASRPFMSPGLYLGWSSQVKQLIQLHKKNVLEGLQVESMEIVKVIHGGAFDDVTVRITARCADYEIDEQSGRMIYGSRRPADFTEYWTFQRGRGAKTTGRSLMDKVCPNCGAPLQINQFGECAYCKAAVTSGRFDWVLSRIEQADEYAA